MNSPLHYLIWAGLIHEPGASCLDVGTRDGKYAAAFAKLGYNVHAIDANPLKEQIPGVTFEHVLLQHFKPSKKFDLIIARNVLQCTADPIFYAKQLVEYLAGPNSILYVSFFGLDDPWVRSGRVRGVTLDAAIESVAGLELMQCQTTYEFGPTIDRSEYKMWHIHTIVARRRSPQEIFERAIEKATGVPIDVLRQTPLEDIPALLKKARS